MADLSPVVQEITQLIGDLYDRPVREVVAAALRAVAAPLERYDPPRDRHWPEAEAFVDGKCVRNSDIYAEINAIATELENING